MPNYKVTGMLNGEAWCWKGPAKHKSQAKAILCSQVQRILKLSVRPYVERLIAVETSDLSIEGSMIDVRVRRQTPKKDIQQTLF